MAEAQARCLCSNGGTTEEVGREFIERKGVWEGLQEVWGTMTDLDDGKIEAEEQEEATNGRDQR